MGVDCISPLSLPVFSFNYEMAGEERLSSQVKMQASVS